jgi:hypothetical protein
LLYFLRKVFDSFLVWTSGMVGIRFGCFIDTSRLPWQESCGDNYFRAPSKPVSPPKKFKRSSTSSGAYTPVASEPAMRELVDFQMLWNPTYLIFLWLLFLGTTNHTVYWYITRRKSRISPPHLLQLQTGVIRQRQRKWRIIEPLEKSRCGEYTWLKRSWRVPWNPLSSLPLIALKSSRKKKRAYLVYNERDHSRGVQERRRV